MWVVPSSATTSMAEESPGPNRMRSSGTVISVRAARSKYPIANGAAPNSGSHRMRASSSWIGVMARWPAAARTHQYGAALHEWRGASQQFFQARLLEVARLAGMNDG